MLSLSQPLGFENKEAVIVPLFFLVTINLLFNNWAKDQVSIAQADAVGAWIFQRHHSFSPSVDSYGCHTESQKAM